MFRVERNRIQHCLNALLRRRDDRQPVAPVLASEYFRGANRQVVSALNLIEFMDAGLLNPSRLHRTALVLLQEARHHARNPVGYAFQNIYRRMTDFIADFDDWQVRNAERLCKPSCDRDEAGRADYSRRLTALYELD